MCVCVCVCVCTRFLSYEKYKSGLKRGGMRENACNLLAGLGGGDDGSSDHLPPRSCARPPGQATGANSLPLTRSEKAPPYTLRKGFPFNAPKRVPLTRGLSCPIHSLVRKEKKCMCATPPASTPADATAGFGAGGLVHIQFFAFRV
jgi:hypothetical protein